MARTAPPRKVGGVASGRRLHTGELNVRLLDVTTLAERLGCSEDEIRARVGRGQLPHRRWSGRLLFLASDIEAFFSELPGTSVAEALANTAERHNGDGD